MTKPQMSREAELVGAFGVLLGFMLGFAVGMLAVFASDHNPLGLFG